jgi:phosphoribosylformimino-5-aminoimidazole carboxamide ribotide isomerase
MNLYPAIDLKDGKCVRLWKGEMARATVFSDDPAAQAKAFEAAGCRWLHIVDLNGAFAGHPVNASVVESILKAVKIPVQLGGGIRDLATIERWLDLGVKRVILGTLAVRAPAIVREACRRFEGRVALGIDARNGKVAVQGWAEESNIATADLARQFEDAGAAAIIFTDIDRDGVQAGLNVTATIGLADSVSVPVIASGGVGSLEDLRALKSAASHADGMIEGVIVGRALYDGAVDAVAALDALKD